MSADPERIGEGGGGGLAVASDAWMGLDTNRRQGNRDDTSSVPTTPTSEAAAAAAADAECSLASCRQSAVRSSGDDQSTYMNLRHKCNRKPVQEHCRPKRETARSMCRPLKQWLYSHRDQPYPSRADKLQLASDSKMTVVQVSNWFANARRRLKKTGHPPAGSSSSPPSAAGPPVVSWEQRFKLYNRNVVGNQERLSISSDESEMDDFNSDDDEAVSAGSAKPCSTSSGNFSGEEKDFPARSSGEGRAAAVAAAAGLLLPGKFKQGILHRYLSDSYRMSFVRGSGGVGGGGGEMDRVRKMSGSPTSRDSALSTSCRSTPVRDQQNDESFERVDVYSSEHFQSQGENADYELESLELSAVHVLASLAASNRNLRTNS